MHKRHIIVLALLVVSALMTVMPAAAQDAEQLPTPTPAPFVISEEVNPNATISFPPPVYTVRGDFDIRGSANLTNQTNYFIEYRQLNNDITIPDEELPWFPVILPEASVVLEDVLGTWDTTTVPDGLYELRLTINVTGSPPVRTVTGPVRVENEIPPFLELVVDAEEEDDAEAPTPVELATVALPPTAAPEPTEDPTPRASLSESISGAGNIRDGDGLNYNIIAALQPGMEVEVIGVSANNNPWYQIRLANGRVGWVAMSIVDVTGDTSSLQRVFPPPPPPTATPIPPTPTPIPPTDIPVVEPTAEPPPSSDANLIAGNVSTNPENPVCNEQFLVSIEIINVGTDDTDDDGRVRVQDFSDGQLRGEDDDDFGELDPNESETVEMELTIDEDPDDDHQLVFTIDYNNDVPESNEDDNTRVYVYDLERGDCDDDDDDDDE